jgi:hypothetical protein
VFGWLESERRERRRKIRLDRKHLEARARRFLKIYLNVDETRKPQFYRVVEEASKQRRPLGSGLPPPELEDNQIAEVTSGAAMKIVVARNALKKDDPICRLRNRCLRYRRHRIPSGSRRLHDGYG